MDLGLAGAAVIVSGGTTGANINVDGGTDFN